MGFSLFINFDGNCRQAVDFYAHVFGSEVQGLMTFSEMPPDPTYVVSEEDRDKIMYCSMMIGGTNVMFSDVPSGMPFTQGNNISPVVSLKKDADVSRAFDRLKAGGTVDMELQTTFWSPLYGMVTDRFGVSWQLMIDE